MYFQIYFVINRKCKEMREIMHLTWYFTLCDYSIFCIMLFFLYTALFHCLYILCFFATNIQYRYLHDMMIIYYITFRFITSCFVFVFLKQVEHTWNYDTMAVGIMWKMDNDDQMVGLLILMFSFESYHYINYIFLNSFKY